jgi:hypothetical protein
VSVHEDYRRREDLGGPSDRSFGITLAIALGVLALRPLFRGGQAGWWLLGASGALAGVALFRPSMLSGANRAWMKLGAGLNRIVTPLMAGLLFWGLVTPLGVFLRWRGRDVLGLRFAADAETYWKARVPPGPPAESMSRQF